jgi:hypothetical protein
MAYFLAICSSVKTRKSLPNMLKPCCIGQPSQELLEKTGTNPQKV